MAKPIRATPELKGTEARRFVERMERREKSKITASEISLAKAIQDFVLTRHRL